jgi:methylglyoxal synthase
MPRRLRGHRIVATGTTGGRVKQAAPHLPVKLLKSGPLGGDQQIGALIAENGIDALFFLVDPLSPMPHDVDVKALMRLALVYNVPMALNLATAEALLTALVAPSRPLKRFRMRLSAARLAASCWLSFSRPRHG